VRCADLSLQDEPLAGTAPEALGFVLVEHAGPWGAKALVEAGHGELEARCKELGLRALLVRRTAHAPSRDRVLAAWCGPDPFLVELPSGELWPALEPVARGALPSGGTRLAERAVLVCTNGRRDACCARDGLPVARELAALLPEATWECSHLGGHRFAANVLVLPEGLCFGRVRPGDAGALVARLAAADIPLELLRGRTALPPIAQAAEIAAGHASVDHPEIHIAGNEVVVAGTRVRLTEEALAPRPVSCGAEPEPVSVWRVRELESP
jgi:hypothetical protein